MIVEERLKKAEKLIGCLCQLLKVDVSKINGDYPDWQAYMKICEERNESRHRFELEKRRKAEDEVLQEAENIKKRRKAQNETVD